MTESEENFQLVWHNYQSNFHEVVGDLLTSEAFTDVSLVAEGRLVRAHRLVLSACSPYLHNVLQALPPAPAAHPIVLLPPEVSLATLHALLAFMYRGVVHVPHAALMAVLHAGDILQVRGLCRDELQRLPMETTSPIPPHKPHQQSQNDDESEEVVDLHRVKEEPTTWMSSETTCEEQELGTTAHSETSADSHKQEDDDEDDGEEPTPLTCEQCHQVFQRAAAWVRHLQIHPPIGTCSRPNTGSSRPSVLTRSSSPCVIRRPHVCSFCGKRFSSRASLSIHARTHTGETPFSCDFCRKGFNVKSNLLRHLRTLHNRIVSPSDVQDPPNNSNTGLTPIKIAKIQ